MNVDVMVPKTKIFAMGNYYFSLELLSAKQVKNM